MSRARAPLGAGALGLAAALAIGGCTSSGQPAASSSRASTAASSNAVTPGGGPASQSASSSSPKHSAVPARGTACGTGLWRHVYHPDRLVVRRKCLTVRGRVTEVRWEPDGDLHILLATRATLVNSGNVQDEHGDLVLEEICQGTVTQADAASACRGVPHNLTVPAVGDSITVTGPWVLDADHGWMEIHPVASLTVTTTAPAPAPPPSSQAPPPPPPSSAAPPAPAGCHPTTPSGNCYEPGEYCPTADAGMTGVAGDGETIVCELESGRYHWHPVG